MNMRQEQKERRHEEILEVALDQFIRRGYAGAKIKDIADAANMSVGLLFHYFPSKEALYIELVTLGVAAPKELVQGFADMEPLAFFEACAQSILQYAGMSLFTAKMFVLMANAQQSDSIPDKAKELVSTLNFYTQTVPLVKLGQKNGDIRQGDPLALSTLYWVALQGVIQTYALNPTSPLPQAGWIVDILREKEGRA